MKGQKHNDTACGDNDELCVCMCDECTPTCRMDKQEKQIKNARNTGMKKKNAVTK